MTIRILMMVSLLFSAVVSAQGLTFGVVPQQSAKKLAAKWSPVLQYISDASGVDIHFTTAKNIPEFEKRLLAGEYDLAYMNPYHYIVFHEKPGYEAVAKQKNKQIKGIVVVRKDSTIQSLSELQDAQLAFPSPAAFAASILPRAQLAKDNIAFTPRYVSSHDSVYLNVSKGFFPAGGGVLRTFNNTSPKVREQLKVLWTTQPYTSHAIAAHPRVAKEKVQKILQAMLQMNDDPQGIALLKTLNFKGLEEATNDRWDDIRGLNIHLLEHMIEE
ncbi:PhnD/SsuA/transferrin family substrate-binding protein [Marinomonas mediterranea]|uniref:phosphate/phosphite/phosphonate ABC transporter substrate-binding protein n=1 Tax=Marinomonas mediterranea TaxID=119864 RepID=UPI00234BD301|nr:phosphate/phosphite/phosphonate ABC transporter substrate-binding protein [Marinomonas mediterranea]WCN12746.1 PhnD/SsuA/transferrin family substrate-binding protein [Marinomonas mediterranea]